MNENNGHEDFYELAKLYSSSYGDRLDEFKDFGVHLCRRVKSDEKLMVRNALNPKLSTTYVVGDGWHWFRILPPWTQESIKIPNPNNAFFIDYRYSDDSEKDELFTFKSVGGELIYCDYNVRFKLADPIRYFYSANALGELRKIVVGVLRSFISTKTFNELRNFEQYTIHDIDINGSFKTFKTDFGLEVVSVGTSSVRQSKEMENMQRDIAIAEKKLELEQANTRAELEVANREVQIKNLHAKQKRGEIIDLVDGLAQKGVDPLATVNNGIINDWLKSDTVKSFKDSSPNLFLNWGNGNNNGTMVPSQYIDAMIRERLGESVEKEEPNVRVRKK